MRSITLRTTIGAGLLALMSGTTMLSRPVCAQQVESAAAKQIDFDIPAQPLSLALNEFATQAGIQVMAGDAAEMLSAQRTAGVKGRLDVTSALEMLLRDTGLEGSVQGRTVRIWVAGNSVSDIAVIEGSRSSSGQMQIAQVGNTADSNKNSDSRNNQDLQYNVQEVVVTAQKRAERLQDVPISMAVLSGGELESATTQDVQDALERVPGVSILRGPAGGDTAVVIRGVSTGRIQSGASTAAYYIDSVPFGFVEQAFVPNPDVYDLERVEVLRGPQGTLYGANALNGVVRVLTREPKLDAFELKLRTSAASTKGGEEVYRGDIAVNAPIIEGKLAARAVLNYQNLGGWIDRPHEDNANDGESRGMRFKLKAKPNEQLSIGASAWLSREDFDNPAKSLANGQNASLIDEPVAVDFDTYGLDIAYELPLFSVASMTSYVDYANSFISDLATHRSNIPFRFDSLYEANTFAQEFNLNSTLRKQWRWTAGGIYRDSEDFISTAIPALQASSSDVMYTSKSYAVFGELTRSFLGGQFELTGGLRYFKDDVARKELSRGGAGVPPEQLISNEDTFDAFTSRLVLTWHPSEQATLYASYSEGFRSGRHQPPLTIAALAPASLPSVEPDSLKNYEVGTKGSLWGGRLNLEAALYFMDWQDVQRQALIFLPALSSYTSIVANGDSASGVGVDFAVTAQPIDGLELGVSFSWNDLTADSDIISRDVVLSPKGERLTLSTESVVAASAGYVFPLGRNGLEGRISASANYDSGHINRLLIGTTRIDHPTKSILVARTSVSIQRSNHWGTTLFVDNLSNERESTDSGDPASPNYDVRVRPRTIGVEFNYHY